MPNRRKPNNKPGGDGKKGGKKKGGRKSEAFKDARRDVMLSIKPARREIRRIKKMGVREGRQQEQKIGNIYGALGDQLSAIGGNYQPQAQQIASGLQGNLAQLAGTIGSNVPGVPQGEISAGAGVLGALGGGALAQLASGAQRSIDFQNSVQRQGAMEGAFATRDVANQTADFRKDLNQQRIDLMRDVPALIRSRMDENQARRFEQMLAMQQLQLSRRGQNASIGLQQQGLALERQSQQALAQYYMDLVRQMTGGK